MGDILGVAHLLAAVFASWRLTELVTMDRLTEPIRQRWPHYLWGCPRCVSVWAGIGVTLAFVTWPWANWPLAFSWLFIAMMDSKQAKRQYMPPHPARPIAGGSGEPWVGILDPKRAINWAGKGTTVINRTTQCGSTIAPYTGTGDTIQTAIDNCAAEQFVLLGNGTFNLSTGFKMKAGVTVRGGGADQTKLIFTGYYAGAPSCIYSAAICFQGGIGLYPPNPDNTANWTAGYTQGATSITLDNVTNLAVGHILVLDQLDDSDTDTGEVWLCKTSGVCCSETATLYRTNRNQVQVVKVTGISGSTVTFTPGLYMPNWRSGQSPGAYWATTAPQVGAGLEDLSADFTGLPTGVRRGTVISNVRDCWVKGVRTVAGDSTDGLRCHFCSLGATLFTIRDGYSYGQSTGQSQDYGIEPNVSSDFLVENTIWDSVTIPLVSGQSLVGTVWGYNYCLNDTYTLVTTWMQASSYHHAIGNQYHLFEGNDGIGFTDDAIHGTCQFMTGFRNRWRGWDPAGGSPPGGKTQQIIAVHIYSYNRYFNIINNVLGESGKHTSYECYPASGSDVGPCAQGPDVSVYTLGWSGNQQKNTNNPAPGFANDTLVRSTLMRWGNWDIVTGTRFDSSEVPTSAPVYTNAVPASQSFPASFYLDARPNAWWRTPWGQPTWPPIGSDVTGGDIASIGGHAYKIPARLCYEHMADDPAYTAGTVRIFNAGQCYQAATDAASPASGVSTRSTAMRVHRSRHSRWR